MAEMGKYHIEMKSLLSVLNYTTKILFPKYPHAIFPLFSSLYITYVNQIRRGIKLLIQTVPVELVELFVQDNINQDCYGDVSACVLINHSALQVLGAKNGSWLKMKIVPEDHSVDVINNKGDIEDIISKQDSCLIRIIGVPDLDESKALVTDIMYHNLKNAGILSDHMEIYVSFECVSRTFNLKGFAPDNDFAPNVSTNATVARIQSTTEIDNKVLDDALKSYFSTPHYLTIGDVFCINITKYSPAVYYYPGNETLKMLHFVVLNIVGQEYKTKVLKNVRCGYHIVKNVTTLLQSSNVNRYLPTSSVCLVNNSTYLTAQNYQSYLLNICPSSLDGYYHQLVTSFKPFMTKGKAVNVKPLFLIFGPRGAGKREIVTCAAKSLGLNVWNYDCLDLQGNTPGYTEGKLKFIFNKVQHFSPCILLLRNIEALCKDKDGNEDCRVISSFHEEVSKLYSSAGDRDRAYPVFVVAICNTNNETVSAIAPSLARAFLHTIHCSTPDEAQRGALLEWLVRRRGLKLHGEVSLSQLAGCSSGFLYADLSALIGHAARNRYRHLKSAEKSFSSEDQIVSETPIELILRKEDFDDALETMHAAYADAIGAPKIPAVLWSDVGGLAKLKEEILRTIMLPLQHPELAASGLRRSGLLLFGPPGTGKTLLAKAVATECSLNFLSVKGPELLNMYVGQSEENVREVFQRARSASPCIIFFDELDSLAPNRGKSGDSGGVMDRVVSQLLAEMDGLQKSSHLFVIGATNRPDLVDPALLRPGRFDKLLYVGVCEDVESQINVLTALTRKFHLKPDVSLPTIAASLPPNLTGADLYSVCSNAWLSAVRSRIQLLKQAGSEATEELSSAPVEVGAEDFRVAATSLIPSVSAADLKYFQMVRQQITS